MVKKRLFNFVIIIMLLTTFLYSFETVYLDLIKELNKQLVKKGIPADWFFKKTIDKNFQIYNDIEKYFIRMPEHLVDRKEKDFDWYKNLFKIDSKIEKGKKFIAENLDLLNKIENKNGIFHEILVAIIGMETNFGEVKGKFYTFNALVSIYLFMPKYRRFALNQLIALYYFSQKINKDVFYFIGSFAGATGLAQFIPTSLLNYFVDSNGIDTDIDIYDLSDSLYSIENYLVKHGLNMETIHDYQTLYKAVYSYNRSNSYVKAVISIYEELRKIRDPDYFDNPFF